MYYNLGGFISSSSITFTDSFSILNEDPLSESGLYTTANYSNSVSASPAQVLWLTSRVVSNQVLLEAKGKLINSGETTTYGNASTVSLSKVASYSTSLVRPLRVKALVQSDTRNAATVPTGTNAGFTVGMCVDTTTKAGLWVSVISTRVGIYSSANTQRITVVAGSTPFGTNYLSAQTVVNESANPENIPYNVDFIIYPTKIDFKMWLPAGTEPESYTSYNYSSVVPSLSVNSLYIGQKAEYIGWNHTGDSSGFLSNTTIHYLDNLSLIW